jgi:hypothetical protein
MTPSALAKCTDRVNNLTFGVEIECTGVSRETLVHAIVSGTGGTRVNYTDTVALADGRKWKVVSDGSIRGAHGYNGGEVVSPILRGDQDLAMLRAVVRAIREAGAISDAAYQCGIHVHIGAKHLAPKALGRLAAQVESADSFIRTAVSVSSARENWCRKLNKDTALHLARQTTHTGIARAWYGSTREANAAVDYHYHSSRYVGLNLHSFFYAGRGTVEFRYFNGTLNDQRIADYVVFCRWMVARAEYCASFGLERAAQTRREASAYLVALGFKDREFNARFVDNFPQSAPVAAAAAA